MTERRRRRCKQLIEDLNKTRGYCKLKRKAIDRTLRRICFGRGYGLVVRQTAEYTNGQTDFLVDTYTYRRSQGVIDDSYRKSDF